MTWKEITDLFKKIHSSILATTHFAIGIYQPSELALSQLDQCFQWESLRDYGLLCKSVVIIVLL